MGKDGAVGAVHSQKAVGLPIFIYNMKDTIQSIVADWRFIDAAIIFAAFLSVAWGVPYYPVAIAAVLAIVLFAAAMQHPFLGLVILAVLVFPAVMYQAPALGWIYLFFFTATMILGYMHYRSIILAFTLLTLSFSFIGRIFFIPFLILTPLLVGFKRGAIVAVLIFIGIIAFSASMGIQNNAYIVYNTTKSIGSIGSGALGSSLSFTIASKGRLVLSDFVAKTGSGLGVFLSQKVLADISNIFVLLIALLFRQPLYLVQLAVTIGMFFAIERLGISERSKYRAVKASILGIIYPVVFIALSPASLTNGIGEFAIFSFFICPLGVYLLELYNFDVFKALEVRKRDIRMKFGESFEDLQSEGTNETFDDIADYTEVKKEMMRSIIGPIEQRGVSRKYGIKPVKGVLLFGPPGNGKTMLMRALANEIHFGFYRIAAPSLISAYSGESEKKLSQIFTIAKKNSPCVLFVDEIDAVGTSRDVEGDEAHKHVLSQLLEELDGFQKLDKVIVVGATNKPNFIDPALLRSGRFDRSIYIPLPDEDGREKIFGMYLSKLPVSKDIDLKRLANMSERLSGADIKNLCEATSQKVARDAVEMHKMLKITNGDLERAIKSTKPSTRLVQIEEYEKFKKDFERVHNIVAEESAPNISMDAVVGYDSFKKTIVESMDVLTHPELAKSYDVRNTNGILIYGPPGTGKTMMMKTISKSVDGISMIELDSSEVIRAGAANAPAVIKEYFYRAQENKPSILFIDEIDGFVSTRGADAEMANEIISEFLKQMDGMRGSAGMMVVATTNKPSFIDPALLRPGRFDKLVYVGPPKLNTRKLMFVRFLRGAPLGNIDFDMLAKMTVNYSGADIAAICNSAKRKAMRKVMQGGPNSMVTQDMVKESINAVTPSISAEDIKEYAEFGKRYKRPD
jgi:SpoVK/Ycf46/Vps4 family AAA+-type ATPase